MYELIGIKQEFFGFITVIKDTLENRGVLGQIKARIRAEVFKSLDDQTDSKPPLSNENMIINELIREYLEFNKYRYTASVMVAGKYSPLRNILFLTSVGGVYDRVFKVVDFKPLALYRCGFESKQGLSYVEAIQLANGRSFILSIACSCLK